MSLKVCADCGVTYLPADACPHCGGGVYRFDWEEEDMPKATVEGGASDHALGVVGEHGPELVDLPDGSVVIPKPKPAPKPKAAAVKAAAEDDN